MELSRRMRAESRSADWHQAAIAWSLICLAVLGVIAAAKIADEFVAPTVLGALIALTLSPVVRSLERRKVPSRIAAALAVAAVLVSSIVVVYWLTPSAEEWRFKAPTVIRSLERKYRDIERKISEGVDNATAGTAEKLSGQDSPTDAVIESGQRLIADSLLDAPKLILTVVYISFLCFFLLAERAPLKRAMLGLVASRPTRVRIARAARDIRQNVSYYLLTLATVNLGLGACAAVMLWITGIPNPLLWGVMIGLLNFMPYVGPMISCALIFVVGLATFPRGEEAFLPVFLYIILNVVEGQFVTPHIVGKRFDTGPLSVFLALAFGAWLWGAFGAVVATPILIVAATLWRHLRE